MSLELENAQLKLKLVEMSSVLTQVQQQLLQYQHREAMDRVQQLTKASEEPQPE